MENKEVLAAALAGLLHDVGKFAQGTGGETRGEWTWIRTERTSNDFD